MEKQQTAVDFFYDFIKIHCDNDVELYETCVRALKQAKQMEKEQIVKAIDSIQLVSRRYYKDGTYADDVLGWEVSASNEDEYFGLSITGEKYYKETYAQQ